MKLVTAMSAAALVLVPAVALAENPANGAGDSQNQSAGDTQNQTGLKSKVEQFMGKVTGSTPDTTESANAKSGDRNSAAMSSGDTDYPDWAAIKKTGK